MIDFNPLNHFPLPPLTPRQPIRQPRRPQGRIPRQHLQHLVPGNGLDFHDIQIRIPEEPAGGLVPQVMEPQFFKQRLFAGKAHRRCDLTRRQAKNRHLIQPPGLFPQNGVNSHFPLREAGLADGRQSAPSKRARIKRYPDIPGFRQER